MKVNKLKKTIGCAVIILSIVLGIFTQRVNATGTSQNNDGTGGNSTQEAINNAVDNIRSGNFYNNSNGQASESQEANSSPNQNNNTQSNSINTNRSQNSSSGTKKCGNTETTIIGCDPENGESAIITLLKMAINILYMIIGVLAVVMVMIAGGIYATAGDSEDKVKTAKTMIKNTMIGIFLYIFMTMILNFLIPGGVF